MNMMASPQLAMKVIVDMELRDPNCEANQVRQRRQVDRIGRARSPGRWSTSATL
jgi:hypothetical protein